MLPLVLLPGMNCTADLWTGCGWMTRSHPSSDEQSVDTQVDRLLAELPPRFVLGGLSLGAIVAMALVARAPERVERLCLVSTNAKAPTPAAAGILADVGRPARRRRERARVCRPTSSPRCSRLPQRRTAPTSWSERWRWRMRPERPRCARSCGCSRTRVDLRPRPARRDRCRHSSCRARRTRSARLQFHAEIAAELPRARVVTIDGGHLLPLEQPDAFGALVAGWRDSGCLRYRGEDRPPVVPASS